MHFSAKSLQSMDIYKRLSVGKHPSSMVVDVRPT